MRTLLRERVQPRNGVQECRSLPIREYLPRAGVLVAMQVAHTDDRSTKVALLVGDVWQHLLEQTLLQVNAR